MYTFASFGLQSANIRTFTNGWFYASNLYMILQLAWHKLWHNLWPMKLHSPRDQRIRPMPLSSSSRMEIPPSVSKSAVFNGYGDYISDYISRKESTCG